MSNLSIIILSTLYNQFWYLYSLTLKLKEEVYNSWRITSFRILSSHLYPFTSRIYLHFKRLDTYSSLRIVPNSQNRTAQCQPKWVSLWTSFFVCLRKVYCTKLLTNWAKFGNCFNYYIIIVVRYQSPDIWNGILNQLYHFDNFWLNRVHSTQN